MNLPTTYQPDLSLLQQSGTGNLHQAAVNILERTGLNVHHEGMREKLAAAGARQGEGPRIHLSGELVERALETAPRKVALFNRNGEPAMDLGPRQIYFGTGSDLIYTNDLESGERRASVLEDVARSARLCDALDEIDFVMSFALPSEIPAEDLEPQQYFAMAANTLKPVIMTSCAGLDSLERVRRMACLLAGGEEAFRARPNLILYGQFVSPLQHNREAIERLIFCAENEIPLIYIPTIMPGASGPITLAGSLALAAAESLAGLVMHQIERPGTPFIFGACVSTLDMRTMLFPYGSPEWRLNDLAMAELARQYGLPVFGTAGATDSKTVDAQTGADYTGSLLVSALAGTNLIHDVGYLDSGLTGSLESIVLGAEQVRWVKRFLRGLEISEEALASAPTEEVGPGRQFLDHSHTLEHLRREVWEPLAADRDGYDRWAAEGSKNYATRARELARELLESHSPLPLGKETAARLKEIANIHSS